MAIYEVGDNAIRPVPLTSFGDAGLRERSDLQRLLRDHIDVIAPEVLVISEEFGEWVDSRRRIDLLGLDKSANLVVIELKRSEDGGHMDLQALRYAAMVSTLTAERTVGVLGKYFDGRGIDADPEQTILEFLEWEALDEDRFGQDVRILLVAADFSRELTSAVMWLNEKDLDLRCVRIQPYTHNSRTLIDVQQVIPLPEAADYQVQLREKKRRERAARSTAADFTRYDIVIDGQLHTAQWKRNAILLVVKGLFRHGRSPEEIQDALAPVRKRIFYSIQGTTEDVEDFKARALAAAAAGGRRFDEGRWHTRDGDLFTHSEQTFAFTNQWGKSWPTAMALLEQTFPELGLEWGSVEAGSVAKRGQ